MIYTAHPGHGGYRLPTGSDAGPTQTPGIGAVRAAHECRAFSGLLACLLLSGYLAAMFRAPPDWWDPHSCQPYKLDVDRKPRFGLMNLIEYARTAGGALLGLPFIAGQYLALKPSPSGLSATEFAGLAVSSGSAVGRGIWHLMSHRSERRVHELASQLMEEANRTP